MPLALETDLIESAKSGGAPLERLVAAVWPEAYRIAYSILTDAGYAEDAAQDACAAMARALPGLGNTSVFAAWSYKIIVNHAISVGRRRPPTQPLDTVADRGTYYDHSDALDLREALAKLSFVQRGVVVLHYYAGLNSGEIAAALHLPSSTVRFHLMLARRTLRKALSGPDELSVSSSEEILSNVR